MCFGHYALKPLNVKHTQAHFHHSSLQQLKWQAALLIPQKAFFMFFIDKVHDTEQETRLKEEAGL